MHVVSFGYNIKSQDELIIHRVRNAINKGLTNVERCHASDPLLSAARTQYRDVKLLDSSPEELEVSIPASIHSSACWGLSPISRLVRQSRIVQVA